ncbi:hypothetical protein [Nocardia sp. NBC_01377]|uniref:hypothetical protein n=1 Tax=Nocardia sp. NBC_01377 TaxID=2903595 RepID=UPI00386A770E
MIDLPMDAGHPVVETGLGHDERARDTPPQRDTLGCGERAVVRATGRQACEGLTTFVEFGVGGARGPQHRRGTFAALGDQTG